MKVIDAVAKVLKAEGSRISFCIPCEPSDRSSRKG